ncbi:MULTISPECIES: DEAD/DEAH box helicase [Bacillus cereus group]|uniref:DEAD/DEAH box helicase n=1 Tax=Bacillus cereus TaxID=1396 RepID=A0A9W7UZ01_BACCE|nr:DEAD/DEAH box helicase family protein [Bacillus cereus]KAB2399539.1 DEAD/DEAH box helicase [Bacillus cereus]KAB2400880.1 DEAD/DEAH box helicase [Bacillus cereus]KAB2431313.1 DEAD/DEAH box helicase [Bacillus cereus]
MFNLKDYQQRTLDSLTNYFNECNKIDDANTAFYKVTKKSFGTGVSYTPVKGLEGIPYVCLRVPTGGGKTIMACHSIEIVQNQLLQTDHSVVLWLVPSNAIKEQTINALKDPSHPYRRALDGSLGSVNVLDTVDALYIKRATLDTTTTIIVSTMQAFRVEDTQGRKVYESSGSLMDHFSGISNEILERLEKNEQGIYKKSLANVLHMRRPILIVDEAHNARTELSFDTLSRFNPSCIIEFTATPDTEDNPSNVLYSVSAAELKAEEMIKIPIYLETRSDWKEIISISVAKRNALEKVARLEKQKTGEYIRPVALIQAQPNRKGRISVTAEVIEKYLCEELKISKEEIAVETGNRRDLEGVNILSDRCPIKYVITVQALKEGWDCPFAYVLCSVAEMRSSTAIEQLLGRIMRMPKAKFKKQAELNRAYAFATSQNFFEAANALTDALVQNGFNKQEAKEFVRRSNSEQQELEWDGAAEEDNDLYHLLGSYSVKLPERPNLENLPNMIAEKLAYDEETSTITIYGEIDDQDKRELENCFETDTGKKVIKQVCEKLNSLSMHNSLAPSERGEKFEVPALAIKQGDLFEIFEETHFLEHTWKLTDYDALLTREEYSGSGNSGQVGEITVTDKGRVQAKFVTELQQQLHAFNIETGWTAIDLSVWLDRNISHPDISPAETSIYFSRVIRTLIDERGISLEKLVIDRYKLKNAMVKKIDLFREKAKQDSFQQCLFNDLEDQIIVTPEVCFSFNPIQYPCSTYYKGSYKFQKHFYPQVGELNERGEEVECAQFIDTLPEVKFWARNLERKGKYSFWLQTSTDKFYPDFVCLLTDGRYLVIEYKGEDRWSNDDSKEKRDIGLLWESKSNGKCLFIMPKGKDMDAIRAKISKK